MREVDSLVETDLVSLRLPFDPLSKATYHGRKTARHRISLMRRRTRRDAILKRLGGSIWKANVELN